MGAFEIIMLIISALSAVGSMASTAAANEQNKELAENTLQKQQDFATQAAQTANQTTLNQYNLMQSPLAKMKQIKAAGLSPGLMYGNGAGISGTSSAAAQAATPAAAVPTMNPIVQLGMMDSVVKAMLGARESQKTKSETEMNFTKIDEIKQNIQESQKRMEEIESKIGVNIATKASIEMDTQLKEVELNFNKDTYYDKWHAIEAQNDIFDRTAKKLEREIYGLDIENKYKDEYWEATNANLKAQKTLMNAQKGVAIAQKLLVNKQAEHEGKKIDLTSLEIRKLTKIVDEYEKFGYKATEANNWATELMSVLREIFSRLFGEDMPEPEVMESASGKGIYYQGKLYYPAENK